MARLEIDEDIVKAAAAVVLAEALTPEKRDELLRHAIRDLLQVRNQHSHTTKLQDLFRDAAGSVLKDLAREQVDTPETRGHIRDLVASAWERVFETDNRDRLVEKMAEHIAQAMLGGRH